MGSESRLAQLDPLIESKNPNVRNEAAAGFVKFSIFDEKVVAVIKKHLTSQAWETRVCAGRALQAVLSSFQENEIKKEEEQADSAAFDKLKTIDVANVLQSFKPLLSESESAMKSREKNPAINQQKQREFVDKHLELSQLTGMTSKKFLSDDEFVIGEGGSLQSPQPESSVNQELGALVKKEEKEEQNYESEGIAERQKTLDRNLRDLINLVTDQQWYSRHGGALAVCQIASTSYNKLSTDLVDSTLYLLIHVLLLDKFNDFITGRNATAPVREQCAQALVHFLRCTDARRREIVLQIVVQMVRTTGDDNWNVRQSGLLILKYYFAIARTDDQNTFNQCFDLVIQSINDSVDDVTGCAVKTLSSILSNKEIPTDEMSQLVEKVMDHVWKLLSAETTKEQLKSGLDAVCIDLLEIVELWLSRNEKAALNREQLLTICSMLDATFPIRSEKIIRLIDVDMDREQNGKLSAEEVFGIVKQLYRIILFTAPSDSLSFLEKTFLTFSRIFKIYQVALIENGEISKKVGNWMSCLLHDHRNPHINVFDNDVDGMTSDRNLPELMCSEEMRFLGERERENVYLTRKILSAKFLSIILEALYESNAEIQGQKVELAVQLLFVPFFQSTSIMHNLGVSIVVNEWAAQYRASINAKTTEKPPPMTILQQADVVVRGPPKQYDEQASIVHTLTKDCNEFVEYCVVRGFNRSTAEQSGGSAEEISKMAYDAVKPTLDTDKKREALENRYSSVTRAIESAKTNIKANGTRINALLSSALFYFGSAPEKLTPQIRPIVETMQTEENDSVSAEVFRGSVPLLVMYSWPRTPRPYIKVLARALESFSGCPVRMPKVGTFSPGSQTTIITMRSILGVETDDGFEASSGQISAASKNAELFMAILCQFNSNQLPEFYAHFDLGEDVDMNTFLIRLELHNSYWNRVGSRLSDQSIDKIFCLVPTEDPAIRFAFAKAIETFCKSNRGDTLNNCYPRLVALADNIGDVNSRLAAIEAFLRLSMMDTTFLCGWATLLAPIVFRMLTDQHNTVRDAAGEAFRRLIPVVTIENPDTIIEGLNEQLTAKRAEYANFIHVLGNPSSLPRVLREHITGGFDTSLLREYQLEGITWIRFMREYGLNGILADDMGLGKTLQTMCSIALSVDRDELDRQQRCSLIVCPRTLVDHWCIEWTRFFPQRPVASKSVHRCRDAEICVIPYEDLKSSSILERVWNYVVLDEGHIMRSPKLRAWHNTHKLVCKSRLILSGTPVQNSPADLWTLFAWLMPGYLGTEKMFRNQFLKKIMKCRLPKVTEAELKTGSVAINQLHKLILPFVMRRLKTEVLQELPDKNVQDYQCELTEDQKEIYRYLVNKCSSDLNDRGETGLSTLVCLIALRKLTDHTMLVQDTLQKVGASQDILDKAVYAKSGKMEALKQLLIECNICKNPEEELPEADSPNESDLNHRALIFCQWQSSARLVSNKLSSGEFGSVVPHLLLDGTTRPGDRMKIVQQFNEDKTIDVLILTTHIGGVGLNLTGADTVIFLDHDWNPMKDLQAIDRAHRLGQTRKVNVYRLITSGTIEEKVMNLAKFKLNTAQALIGADNKSMMTMATGELMEMFTLDGDESVKRTDEPATKRARANTSAKIEEIDLANVWDESQYDEFQVESFLKNA